MYIDIDFYVLVFSCSCSGRVFKMSVGYVTLLTHALTILRLELSGLTTTLHWNASSDDRPY